MTIKELLHAEIDNLPEEDLNELYQLVRHYIAVKSTPEKEPGALAKLRRIKISGPADFSTNLDLYLSGEQGADSDENLP